MSRTPAPAVAGTPLQTVLLTGFGKGFFKTKPVVGGQSAKTKQRSSRWEIPSIGTPRQRIMILLALRGVQPEEVLLLFRSRKIMVHMKTEQDATDVLSRLLAEPLSVNSKPIMAEVVAFAFDRQLKSQNAANADQVRKECAHCIENVSSSSLQFNSILILAFDFLARQSSPQV